jgi:2'-5' RNA ligase
VRLFVALQVPAEVAGHADRALEPVRAAYPGLRWVPAQRWHLTLAFFGEVADASVEDVVARVGRRCRGHGPLELRLAGSGRFSRRALWLGVAGDVDRLRALARAVAYDPAPYRPHLTIARLRGDVDPVPAQAALAGYAGPAWVAGTVHLVRSRLGPAPSYADVATYPLTPPEPRP